jgi:type VI protein secretion system component VasF
MAQNGVPQSVEYRGINTAEILNELFKDFYYELLKCKEKALRSHQMAEELEQKAKTIPEGQTNRGEEAANENLHPLTAHRHESVPIHEAKAMQEIQRYLLQVLTEKIQPFLHMLDAQSLLLLKEAQYAMIALADEVFLTLPWKGSHAWRFELLESQFFQTQSSGEQIFKKIDELLSHYDLSKEPLASIYFHILALGFRGLSGKGEYGHFEKL